MRAFPSEFGQVVGLEFDAVEFVVAAEFAYFFFGFFLRHHHFAFFVACKFVEKVLFGVFLPIFLFGTKVGWYVEFRHDGVGIDAVGLYFVDDFLRIFECFGQVAEYGGHLFGRFQPLLFGVVHAVRFAHQRVGRYADEVVVRVGVLLFHEVRVVGADDFCAGFSCQFYQHGIHLFLPQIHVLVAAEFVGFVALQFDVVVVAEHRFEPAYRCFGLVDFALHDELWQFAAQASRRHDESLVVLCQQLFVDARPAVFTVDEGLAHNFAQVVVAHFVFGQYDEVPAAVIDDLFFAVGIDLFQRGIFQQAAAAGAVGFHAHDGFEWHEIGHFLFEFGQFGFEFGQFGFGFVRIGECLVQFVDVECVGADFQFGFEFWDLLYLLFGALDVVFAFVQFLFGRAVHLFAVVEQFFDAEHVAVVGQGHGVHAGAHTFVDQIGYFRHAVENGVVRVYV